MRDQDKTKQQLVSELEALRRRLAAREDADTERGQAEAAMTQSQVILQATIENLPFDFFAVGPDGRYIMQNAASKAHWGEALGKLPQEVCANQEDLALWLENNRRAFAGEKVEAEVELTVEGEKRWYYNVLVPIRGETATYGILGMNVDITARKRAETALQRSRDDLERRVQERTAELAKANEELAIFRKFAEASGQGFGMGDLESRIVYANPAMCRLMGEDKLEDVVGKRFRSYYGEGWEEQRAREVLPALGREDHWEGELAIRSRQGKLTPTLHHIFSLRDEQGRPFRRGVVVTDISDRKRAEEALRESERRFRNYFEQGLIGMAVTSLDKRWLEVNDRLCAMLGYSREELLQTDWAALTHPDDVEPNLRLFRPLLAGEIEHFTLQKRYLRKDGSVVHATIYTRAFRKDGTIDHVVTLIEDISERKRAEEALRQSEEKHRSLMEACPDAVVMSDLTGHVLFASRQTWTLLGLADADELIGRSVFDYVIESDRGRLAANLTQLVQAGVRRNTEYTALRKDGSTVPTETCSTAIRDAAGEPKAVMAVIRDISERKKAQEALERERQSLWRMLQAGDHERQVISYDIHDGLAQYLAAAGMQLQVHDALQTNSPDEAKKAYETAVELVHQSHAEARRLINAVRPPVIDEVGIETAMAHLVHEQRRQGGPRVHFDSNVQFDRLPPILENAIYRIVQEALNNACKHSNSQEVKVTMTQDAEDVRLEVQDWGVGFDPEAVEKGHFGLEGIRQRVRLLGGRLTIASTPGSGTLVQAVVPILERQTAEQAGLATRDGSGHRR